MKGKLESSKERSSTLQKQNLPVVFDYGHYTFNIYIFFFFLEPIRTSTPKIIFVVRVSIFTSGKQ